MAKYTICKYCNRTEKRNKNEIIIKRTLDMDVEL